MAERTCACDGLNLLRQMMDTYVIFDSGKPYKFEAQMVSQGLHSHLRRQANQPGNQALKVKVDSLLIKQEHKIQGYKKGNEPPMHVLDTIRDDIHQSDELKQLLVCGGPFQEWDDAEDNAKVVKIVMDMLAAEGPPFLTVRELAMQAKQPLDALVEQLSCPAPLVY